MRTFLDAVVNGITDVGMEPFPLATATGALVNLRSLELYNNKIGDVQFFGRLTVWHWTNDLYSIIYFFDADHILVVVASIKIT